jgi:(p)ppGpp synthase/HD superfamily hydrolase
MACELGLIDRAIGFAARAHAGQVRKTGVNMPYIAHPFAVGVMLLQMGCDETTVAAGLLHDTVEDTAVTLAEVAAEFGEQVAAIVAICTEPPKSQPWEARKQHLVEALRGAPLEAKLVAAADKVHNLCHTQRIEAQLGPQVWQRFGRPKAQQAGYYRAIQASIAAGVADPERYPIFGELARLVDVVFADSG